MSSRTSRKAAHPRAKAPEPIITRNKSAQQKRQLRKKELKKTEKPELTKPDTKSTKQPETKSTKEPEIRLTKIDLKSPKITKIVKRSQVSLLKPVEVSDEVLEQIEYYPNTLKRDIRTKKIMLKPKHNFKVVAATNKRKLATPQKGTKSPSSNPLSPKPTRITRPCSPELSMQDMVRMMDETRSLSDEDFMEILTCPSPVWWEDPPDGGFDEGSIHTRMPEPPPKKITNNKKRKISTNKTKKSHKKNIVIDLVDDIEPPKRKMDTTDERFVKKKQKLESILGNIKNKVNEPKKSNTRRNISESEGDFSDLGFNEEEVLKNLENMDIPIAESPKESNLIPKTEIENIKIKKELIDTHENEIVATKNDEADENVPSTDLKPVITEVFSIKSSVFDSDEFKSEVCSEEISLENKSDDVVVVDSTNSSLGNSENTSSVIDLIDNTSNCETGKKSPIVDDSKNSDITKNDVTNKKTKVLSEYINVYKITQDNIKNENSDIDSKTTENNGITKLEAVLKLNDFFRHCKSSKRLQKYKKTIPANSVTDVKEKTIEIKKENSDETIDLEDDKNRLKSNECSVQKTENGTKECFHEKCDISPVFPCGLCNFKTDTKEVLMQHVSSCKDVARINWSHNYVLNQT